MNRSFFAFVSLCTLLLAACQKEDLTPNSQPPVKKGQIRFDQPEVGQQSRYVLFQGSRYADPQAPDAWTYRSDTLIVEIVGQDDAGFLLEERLSEGSHARSADTAYLPHPDTVYRYYMQVETDSVHFFAGEGPFTVSHFFQGALDSRKLPLDFIAGPKTAFSGWKTDLPYCECYREAYAENSLILGQHYDHPNVIINNAATQHDALGFTYAYHLEGGLVRYYYVSWWFQSGQGWDRLPE